MTTIITLCTGNAARSVMAGAILVAGAAVQPGAQFRQTNAEGLGGSPAAPPTAFELRAQPCSDGAFEVPARAPLALGRLRERRRAHNLIELCVEPGGNRIGEARQRLITVLVDEPS
mgnify:CR=1 FL=1